MPEPSCGWWVMDDETLRYALERAKAGEDVAVILLELYANSDVEVIGE